MLTTTLRLLLLVAASCCVVRASLRHVTWSPTGVSDEQYKVTVRAGDRLMFLCPNSSYSTIWFISEKDHYDSCNCDHSQSGCILLSNCHYFNPNNYTTAIQSISTSLPNTPDYRPGNSYYFASFSENISTLARPSSARSGGECAEHSLRLEIEVEGSQEEEDSTLSPKTSPLPTTEKPTTPTDPVGSWSGAGEKKEKPDVFDVEVGTVENKPPESLIDSSSPSPSPSQLLPLLTLVSLLAILSLTCY